MLRGMLRGLLVGLLLGMLVGMLRGMLLGAAAGLATCASSMVLREASSQYADMALAMFSTAACASLAVAMHNAVP